MSQILTSPKCYYWLKNITLILFDLLVILTLQHQNIKLNPGTWCIKTPEFKRIPLKMLNFVIMSNYKTLLHQNREMKSNRSREASATLTITTWHFLQSIIKLQAHKHVAGWFIWPHKIFGNCKSKWVIWDVLNIYYPL